MNASIRQSVEELAQELRALYGSRFRGLTLYGSHARAQAVDGSDIDVALILDDFPSAGKEISAFAALVARLCLTYNCVFSVLPIRERDWRTRQSPLLMNIRREGVAIA